MRLLKCDGKKHKRVVLVDFMAFYSLKKDQHFQKKYSPKETEERKNNDGTYVKHFNTSYSQRAHCMQKLGLVRYRDLS